METLAMVVLGGIAAFCIGCLLVILFGIYSARYPQSNNRGVAFLAIVGILLIWGGGVITICSLALITLLFLLSHWMAAVAILCIALIFVALFSWYDLTLA